MQKYFDQAISGNWSYNPLQYENNEVPLSIMAQDMLTSYKYGWKTVYYQNTYDFKGEEEEVQPAGLSAVVEDDYGEDVELESSNKQIVNGHSTIDTKVEVKAIQSDEDCDACTI
jgi:ribonucleoside-diphosphate reductase alpha chain